MSLTVDIVIHDGERRLGSATSKPVRHTPLGCAGVVHGGVVHPLRKGNKIDLSDQTFSKADCQHFYGRGEQIEYFLGGEEDERYWSTEFSDKGNYLVFDGDDRFADTLFEHLFQQEIGLRIGRSFRKSKDGRFYDWFVRIATGASEQDVTHFMENYHGGDVPLSSLDNQANSVDDVVNAVTSAFQEKIQGMRLERDKLYDELQEVRDEVRRLRAKRNDLKASFERTSVENETLLKARDAYKSDAQRLRLELRKSRARRLMAGAMTKDPEDIVGQTKKENERLWDEIESLEQKFEDSEIEKARLTQESSRQSREIGEQEELIATQSEQIDDLSNQLRQANQMAERLDYKGEKKTLFRLIGAMSDCFLSSVHLENDDLSRLIQDVPDPEDMLQTIRKIDLGEEVRRSKWKGKKNVWEVRNISVGHPGQNKMGRIYFERKEDGIHLALHVKKDDRSQERFVDSRFS